MNLVSNPQPGQAGTNCHKGTKTQRETRNFLVNIHHLKSTPGIAFLNQRENSNGKTDGPM
jgi:hypothetical protein